jgi:DNA polymerase-3 subunit gamma/tau
MFYTEYRPQKFKELIGADHIVASVTATLAKETPAHAYFFTGSRGTGKTTTARLLAKALNCQSPIISEKLSVKYEPCGECDSCLAIKKGNHLDLIEIDAASNRGIDNIRELKDGVSLSPSMGKRKIYIIDEVHMLTTEASNALLKTLEEPPEHVYFILCTTNPEKVLDTIKSRCLQFQFKRPTINDLVSKLDRIAKDKNYEISEGDLKMIAVASKGAYRDAETLLEQFISDENQFSTLIESSTNNNGTFFKYILENDRANAIDFVQKVYESGVSIESWTEKLISYLRTLMLTKIGVKVNESSFSLTDADNEIIKVVSEDKLKRSLEVFTKTIAEFKTAVIPTLPLELAVIELTQQNIGNNNTTIPTSYTVKETPKQTESKLEVKVEAAPIHKLDIRLKKSDSPKVTAKPEPQEDKLGKSAKTVPFSYKQLIEAVKPKNHAIHLILHSCQLINFDGKYLDVRAFYSFHKERLLSTKIREIIQDVASEMTGSTVVLRCELSNKNPDAKKLTDKNIVEPKEKADLEDVFEKVFGEDIATTTE